MGEPVCDKCGKAHERAEYQTGSLLPTCVGHRHRTNEPCRQWRPNGGTVCYMHGGGIPAVKAKRAQRLAKFRAAKYLGKPVQVDPTRALMHALWLAYGDLLYWANAVKALTQGGAEGLVMRGMQGASMVHVYQTEYTNAQTQVARLSKLALDAGIEQRKVQIYEAQATMLAELGRRFLAQIAIRFSLSREQMTEARDLFREQLALMEPSKDPEAG